MELAAIWMPENQGQKRFAPGDLIAYDFVGIRMEEDFATHKIIGCYGDISSTHLEMMAVDIITNEPIIIKIK